MRLAQIAQSVALWTRQQGGRCLIPNSANFFLEKKKLLKYWCEKARKHIGVVDRHDMTLAVKVAFNLNTSNQPNVCSLLSLSMITVRYTTTYVHNNGQKYIEISLKLSLIVEN